MSAADRDGGEVRRPCVESAEDVGSRSHCSTRRFVLSLFSQHELTLLSLLNRPTTQTEVLLATRGTGKSSTSQRLLFAAAVRSRSRSNAQLPSTALVMDALLLEKC